MRFSNRFHPAGGRTLSMLLLGLVAVLVVMGLLRNCRPPSNLEPPARGFSQGDTLDVAVVYGPGSYRMQADTLSGENHRLLTLLRDSLGWKLRLWPVASAQEALPQLAEGRYDIVASLPSDNELKSRFLTTREVWLDRLVLIQAPSLRAKGASGPRRIESALELAGDTVYVEKGSSAVRRLGNLSHEIGDTIYIIEKEGLGEELMVMKTASGEWPFAVVSERTAKSMKEERYRDLDISTPVSFTQFQVWALRPSDTLLKDSLDAALGRLQGETLPKP